MQLKDVLAALKRFKFLSIAVFVLFVAAGVAAASLQGQTFQATATLIAEPNANAPSSSSVPTVQFMLPAILQRVETEDFRQSVFTQQPQLAAVPDLSITATQTPGTGILYVTATSKDKGVVTAASNAGAKQLIAGQHSPLVVLQLLNPALVPTVSPNNKIVIIAASVVLGLMAAVLAALLANSVRRPVVQEGDLESVFGLELLGDVPKRRVRSPLISTIFTDRANVEVSDAFQKLAAALQTAGILESHREIAIVSCVSGEGKTSVASGLAFAMALTGHRTLLIDADLRDPTIHTRFGVPLSPGLADGSARLEARHEIMLNLEVITAGRPHSHPTNVVTRKLAGLAPSGEEMEPELILLDTPPLALAPEAMLISHLVSGVIMVVEVGQTDAKLLERSLHDLRRSGVEILGAVVNRSDHHVSAGPYSAYYGVTFPASGPGSTISQPGVTTFPVLKKPARERS